MRTLTKRTADSFVERCMSVCKKLTRDEIFFWSRSQELLKEMLLQPIGKLNVLKPLSVSKSLIQHSLDASPFDSQVVMYQHFLSVCKKMTASQVRFWLKSESVELLISMLKKGEISFLDTQGGLSNMPEIQGGRTLEIFRSKNFRQDRDRLYDISEELPSLYQSSVTTSAVYYRIACNLTGNEIFRFVGEEDCIKSICFTPGQVSYLCSLQRRSRQQGILQFSGFNYFPVLSKNKGIKLISLQWSPPPFGDRDAVGRWCYCVLPLQYECKGDGRFFILG